MIDPDSPAFPATQWKPYSNSPNNLGQFPTTGLTIRAHLAAMAMQGLLTCQSSSMNLPGDAVAIADALIAELNKEKPNAK